MKKYGVLFICILFFAVESGARAFQRERVYLQTDKQLYISGELLWMKLYTTDEKGKLISFSKIGYVELLSDSIPEVQVKLDITAGTGVGCMELSPMLSTGYYRLVAYTRNMRNEKDDVFFEKTIGIINPYVREGETIGNTDDINTPHSAPLSQEAVHSNIISTDRSLYSARSKGEILLKNLPAENISLAVSVAGIDSLFIPESQVMNWKNKLLSLETAELAGDYLPEYEGAIIEWRIINTETGEAEQDQYVNALLSFPGKDIQLFGGQRGKDGHISFFTHQISGKKEIAIVAYASYKEKYRLDLFSPFAVHTVKPLPPLRIDSGWQDYLEQRNLAVQVVEAYTADSLSKIKPLPSYFNYKPYKTYILDEYTRFPRMDEIFIEFILPARIHKTNNGRVFNILNERMDRYALGKPLILLDNIPVVNHELMASYNPLLVRKIEVYLGRYLFGGQLFEGMISFSTYNSNSPSITFGQETQLFDYEGTQGYRYFYSPAYEEGNISTRIPDFRHTLLWEPSVESKGKKELVIPFYTSDLPGNYRVIVEGIGVDGSAVSASCSFEVK
jgi:hypothetical protein